MPEEKLNNTPESKEPIKQDKLFYTISEVALMFKVKPSLIRFWEKEFTIIKPRKNKKGNRLFTHKDIENFHLIYHLVKERGMTLHGAKQKLKDNKDDTNNNFEIVKNLQELRSLIIEIRDSLD